MSTDKTYNGWTNYETWVVALWMDNEQGVQQMWHETARDVGSAVELADMVKESHEQNAPEVTGVFADLQNAALAEVDWLEIARNLLDAVKE